MPETLRILGKRLPCPCHLDRAAQHVAAYDKITGRQYELSTKNVDRRFYTESVAKRHLLEEALALKRALVRGSARTVTSATTIPAS